MTVNRLPPPPVANDFKSPAWQDWFYKLIALLNTALPGTAQPVMDASVFARLRPLEAPANPADFQTLGAVRSFNRPVPAPADPSNTQNVLSVAALLRPPVRPVDLADSQSILAHQIFGG